LPQQKKWKRKQMRSAKLMLGGGATAIIAAIVIVATGFGNREKQIVPIMKVLDSARPAVAALVPEHSSRSFDIATDQVENNALQERVVTLNTGDTLMEVLLANGVPRREAYAASVTMEEVYDPRDLRAGQEIKLFIRDVDDLEEKRCFERLEFVPETDRLISVEHETHDSFSARIDTVPHVSTLVAKSGVIKSSFFEAARVSEVPTSVLLASYGTLSYALDFQRDFQVGDTFEIGFSVYNDGPERGQHPGELVYVSIDLRGQSIRAYRYTTSDGYTGLFDESGASLSTNLLKTPIDGARLSSLFGKRKHPILGYKRMHRGLDFGASHGTPVLAAGDGIVVQRGRNGDFGKYIRIKHDATYSTAYAHLSRYADKLKSGKRIRQGEVIGYVGATGLATGPNLHYEVLRGRRQVDPMKVKLPPRRLLGKVEMARFEREKEKIHSLLAFQPKGVRSRQAVLAGPEVRKRVAPKSNEQKEA
jgi:murein DD-endopeptidase MepM/ murein hydrolase activator NlpD